MWRRSLAATKFTARSGGATVAQVLLPEAWVIALNVEMETAARDLPLQFAGALFRESFFWWVATLVRGGESCAQSTKPGLTPSSSNHRGDGQRRLCGDLVNLPPVRPPLRIRALTR